MNGLQRKLARGLAPLFAAALLAFGSGLAQAANIVIINNNAPGVGFNDPTPVAPVGGNPGTTLGDQRLFIFQHAANIWGGILQSAVTIEVRAQFSALSCAANSAVLGSAGPISVYRDFAGADYAGTWYHVALANKLAGIDLDGVNPDINANFNLNIDAGCFGPGLVWYYGIDGNEGVNIELLPVVLHELGHGLGFSTVTNGSTGAPLNGFPSVYDRFLLNNQTGLHWYQMTNVERQASAINTDHLVWDGPTVFNDAPGFLGGQPELQINSPGGIAGLYTVQTATFGAALTLAGVSGDVVLADDGVVPINDGCEAITNNLAGKIALIDRGTCTFALKTKNAQDQGAIGVIIANNVAAGLPGMGGADPTITIPAVGISQADGNLIKANLGAGVNVTLKLDAVLKAGTDPTGYVKMYAPNPFQGGSSVSHYDVSLNPNALMEPAINTDLHDTVDLTESLFHDIGWFPMVTATTLSMFTAEGRRDGIALRWQFADPSDVSVVSLERALTADGPWSAVSTELVNDGSSMVALDTNVLAGTDYFYRLNVIDRAGEQSYMGLASARRADALAAGVFMAAPQPNPSRNGTSIRFSLSQPEFVRLSVVDAGGRQVRTLHEGMMAAGEHTRSWNGLSDHETMVPAGVYFIHLRTSQGTATQRIAMVR
jgi:PA domain/FlgD Ig-like domain